MEKEKNIIWTNEDVDMDEWIAYIREEHPDYSEEEAESFAYEYINMDLEDQRVNLSIELNESIIVIGDLGLWNGRRTGYKELNSNNIKDCLYNNYDYATWYVDKLGDLRCREVHHDGVNYYTYRVWKEGVSDTRKEWLKDRIFRGVATRKDITAVTNRLGDPICEVYGWNIRKQGPRTKRADGEKERCDE